MPEMVLSTSYRNILCRSTYRSLVGILLLQLHHTHVEEVLSLNLMFVTSKLVKDGFQKRAKFNFMVNFTTSLNHLFWDLEIFTVF